MPECREEKRDEDTETEREMGRNSVSFYWKLQRGMSPARQDDVDIQYPYCWPAEFMANKVVK